MARNGRSRNRSRGRNRGGVYSAPIPEPANSGELDLIAGENGEVSYNDIFAAIIGKVQAAAIQKFRISSVVIDPIVRAAGSISLTQVGMGISGNHYQAISTTKPLKVRLGKEYGDDGMWIVTEGASALTQAMFPGTFGPSDMFLDTFAGALVHIRYAWTDPT